MAVPLGRAHFFLDLSLYIYIYAQGDGKGEHNQPVPLQMVKLRQEGMNWPSKGPKQESWTSLPQYI